MSQLTVKHDILLISSAECLVLSANLKHTTALSRRSGLVSNAQKFVSLALALYIGSKLKTASGQNRKKVLDNGILLTAQKDLGASPTFIFSLFFSYHLI